MYTANITNNFEMQNNYARNQILSLYETFIFFYACKVQSSSIH